MVEFTEQMFADSPLTVLRAIAKEVGVVGRWDMNKPQLVNAIVYASNQKQLSEVGVISPQSESKDEYIDNAQIGEIVAFQYTFRREGILVKKMVAGKIAHIYADPLTFKVVTKKGSTYNLTRKQIEWVKTGSRWPKGIYEKMKGDAVAVDETQC